MPYVTALSDFREKVRDVAREENGKLLIEVVGSYYDVLHYSVPRVLSLCDWVRDELMVDLGVRLEDKTGKKYDYMEPKSGRHTYSYTVIFIESMII